MRFRPFNFRFLAAALFCSGDNTHFSYPDKQPEGLPKLNAYRRSLGECLKPTRFSAYTLPRHTPAMCPDMPFGLTTQKGTSAAKTEAWTGRRRRRCWAAGRPAWPRGPVGDRWDWAPPKMTNRRPSLGCSGGIQAMKSRGDPLGGLTGHTSKIVELSNWNISHSPKQTPFLIAG